MPIKTSTNHLKSQEFKQNINQRVLFRYMKDTIVLSPRAIKGYIKGTSFSLQRVNKTKMYVMRTTFHKIVNSYTNET